MPFLKENLKFVNEGVDQDMNIVGFLTVGE